MHSSIKIRNINLKEIGKRKKIDKGLKTIFAALLDMLVDRFNNGIFTTEASMRGIFVHELLNFIKSKNLDYSTNQIYLEEPFETIHGTRRELFLDIFLGNKDFNLHSLAFELKIHSRQIRRFWDENLFRIPQYDYLDRIEDYDNYSDRLTEIFKDLLRLAVVLDPYRFSREEKLLRHRDIFRELVSNDPLAVQKYHHNVRRFFIYFISKKSIYEYITRWCPELIDSKTLNGSFDLINYFNGLKIPSGKGKKSYVEIFFEKLFEDSEEAEEQNYISLLKEDEINREEFLDTLDDFGIRPSNIQVSIFNKLKEYEIIENSTQYSNKNWSITNKIKSIMDKSFPKPFFFEHITNKNLEIASTKISDFKDTKNFKDSLLPLIKILDEKKVFLKLFYCNKLVFTGNSENVGFQVNDEIYLLVYEVIIGYR